MLADEGGHSGTEGEMEEGHGHERTHSIDSEGARTGRKIGEKGWIMCNLAQSHERWMLINGIGEKGMVRPNLRAQQFGNFFVQHRQTVPVGDHSSREKTRVGDKGSYGTPESKTRGGGVYGTDERNSWFENIHSEGDRSFNERRRRDMFGLNEFRVWAA